MFYQNKNNKNSFIYLETLTPRDGILDCYMLSFTNSKWVSWSTFIWIEELGEKYTELK
jgi:hypothetical protein